MTDSCSRCASSKSNCRVAHAWTPIEWRKTERGYLCTYLCACCGHSWDCGHSLAAFERQRNDIFTDLFRGLDISSLTQARAGWAREVVGGPRIEWRSAIQEVITELRVCARTNLTALTDEALNDLVGGAAFTRLVKKLECLLRDTTEPTP